MDADPASAAASLGLPKDQGGAEGDTDFTDSNPSVSTQIMQLAQGQGVELFHDCTKTAYAAVPMPGGANEALRLGGRSFDRWLRWLVCKEWGSAISAAPIQHATKTLEGIALNDGVMQEVHLRIAAPDDVIVIDLANAKREQVIVDRHGWKIVTSSPARFRRSSGMLALPRPVAGGSIDDLRELINVMDDDQFMMVVAWLIGALRPIGPYPILNIMGEHGSAKSSMARTLRSLVDPSMAPLRAPTRDVRDLMISTENGWVVCYDNISSKEMTEKMSNALCRLATGGGLATRALYTDGDEKIFDAMRPAILTSIDDVVTRGDLADRSLTIRLPRLTTRRTEKDLKSRGEALAPQVFGALLDAVVYALRNLDQVTITSLPRMADFAHWIEAASKNLAWAPGAFLDCYSTQRQRSTTDALEADTVAEALIDLITSAPGQAIEATAGAILRDLEAKVQEKATRSPSWPKSPRAMANRLRRLAPALREAGFIVEEPAGRRDRGRLWLLDAPTSPTDSSASSESSEPIALGDGATDEEPCLWSGREPLRDGLPDATNTTDATVDYPEAALGS